MTKKNGIVMGIDEAGRGPVLGPMVYAAAYWNMNDSDNIPKGLADSKILSSLTRATLFEQIQASHNIGFVVRILHASEISGNMLRKNPKYNLNEMSHDAAIQMIHSVLEAGVSIQSCYIDTVGTPESYRAKLNREFDGCGITFVVEKKADAKYTCCSAASVSKSEI
jgi:ribonuclease H2 subunit A